MCRARAWKRIFVTVNTNRVRMTGDALGTTTVITAARIAHITTAVPTSPTRAWATALTVER
jgi:hypothetical protein